MMTLRLNEETGNYEVHGPLKYWLGLLGTVAIIASSLVTYTYTVTTDYSQVKQDIALIRQAFELHERAHQTTHTIHESRIDRLERMQDQQDARSRRQAP